MRPCTHFLLEILSSPSRCRQSARCDLWAVPLYPLRDGVKQHVVQSTAQAVGRLRGAAAGRARVCLVLRVPVGRWYALIAKCASIGDSVRCCCNSHTRLLTWFHSFLAPDWPSVEYHLAKAACCASPSMTMLFCGGQKQAKRQAKTSWEAGRCESKSIGVVKNSLHSPTRRPRSGANMNPAANNM